jgi:hypothetical protein
VEWVHRCLVDVVAEGHLEEGRMVSKVAETVGNGRVVDRRVERHTDLALVV